MSTKRLLVLLSVIAAVLAFPPAASAGMSLTVEVQGYGTVYNDAGRAPCVGTGIDDRVVGWSCTESFSDASGPTVRLNALPGFPNTNWRHIGWTGCTSIEANNICVVTGPANAYWSRTVRAFFDD